MKPVSHCRALRVVAAFGLAVAGVAFVGPASPAQDTAKGPAAKPIEIYQQLRGHIAEGKFDVAAIFLQAFLDGKPTDQDLLDVEARYGSTAFQQLRTIRKWSDDPKVDAKARANVEEVVKSVTAATEKVLRNPTRVNKFIRNLGETFEERQFAEVELRRTGDYAIPHMVDALRANLNTAVTIGILGAIPQLEAQAMAGWVAALDGIEPNQQFGVLAALASRNDVLALLASAQTDFTPYLWRVAGDATAGPTLRKYARELLDKLVAGAEKKQPEAELVAFARTFANHKARYMGSAPSGDGTPTTVPVWTWNGADNKLAKQENVPVGQADEYFGLRYARWALERQPDYEPAQVAVLTIAADRAMDRGKFGDLAKTDPIVYRLLADAPIAVLTDLLDRSLFEKRTGLVLALTQVLGDRAEKGPGAATASGKASLFERALDFPDPRVQLAAANALLRSPTPVDPKLRGKVLDVLKRAAGADATVPPTAKGQAIIGDPNRQRADDIAIMLRGLGYDVEIFATGRELLKRSSRASDFDLVVIDQHVAGPELLDVVAQLRADARAARRPVLVVASNDLPTPPTLDQLLLRFALLIAATETDPTGMPDPYVPDPRKSPEQQDRDRKTIQERRDNVFRTVGLDRRERMKRVLATTGLDLTSEQQFQVELRIDQITSAVLAAEYPLTADSSPKAYETYLAIQKQLGIQPAVQSYQRRVGVDHLMKLIERLESDVNKAKASMEKYEALRTRVDPDVLGLKVETTRDAAAEARLTRLLRSYPAVRVIPEPPTRFWLETDINAVFQNAADRPRDPAEKMTAAKLAVSWLAKMATCEVPGFDAKVASAELIAALRSDETAEPAIPGVARFPTAEAQQGLLTLALTSGRPMPLRISAADAAVRHVQINGKLTPATLGDEITKQAASETNADLRAKWLVLKGLLAPNAKDYMAGLKSYSPPLVPPAPMPPPVPPMPEPKP